MVDGNIDGKPLFCGGLRSQISKDGGFQQNVVKNCYYFDQNSWKSSYPLSCPRWGASSIRLSERKTWVLGGNPDRSLAEECLETATSSEILTADGSYTLSFPLPEPMVYHCAAKINESHVFIVNGFDENYEGISRAYVADISAEPFTFTQLPPLRKGRSEAACGVITLSNPSQNESHLAIIVAGGGYGKTTKTTEVYKLTNPFDSENIWETGPVLPRGFVNGCHINSDLNSFILIGGFDDLGKLRSDMVQYNSNSEEFEILPARLSTPRYGCSAIKVQNNGECLKRRFKPGIDVK